MHYLAIYQLLQLFFYCFRALLSKFLHALRCGHLFGQKTIHGFRRGLPEHFHHFGRTELVCLTEEMTEGGRAFVLVERSRKEDVVVSIYITRP